MRKEPFKLFISIAVMAVALFLVLTSCETTEEELPESIDEAPIIPPESTFAMSFDDFNDMDTSKNKSLSIVNEIPTYQNWWRSTVEVFFWNAAVTITMVLPVASFVESFNHLPIYHANGKYWTWSYNFKLGGIHNAELKGFYENDSVVWEMRIDEKMAYEGKCHKDRTGGYWLLKKDLSHTDYWLQIDWSRENDSIGQIKYTNILPDDTENGGFIYFGTSNDPMNRNYHIYKKSIENLVKIEWNSNTHEGRISNPAIYGDDSWQCWNNLLQDAVCE